MTEPKPTPTDSAEPAAAPDAEIETEAEKKAKKEVGGPGGPEPTRFGDWERKGRCIDF